MRGRTIVFGAKAIYEKFHCNHYQYIHIYIFLQGVEYVWSGCKSFPHVATFVYKLIHMLIYVFIYMSVCVFQNILGVS